MTLWLCKKPGIGSDRPWGFFFQIPLQYQDVLVTVAGDIFNNTAAEQETFSEHRIIKIAVEDFFNLMDFI